MHPNCCGYHQQQQLATIVHSVSEHQINTPILSSKTWDPETHKRQETCKLYCHNVFTSFPPLVPTIRYGVTDSCVLGESILCCFCCLHCWHPPTPLHSSLELQTIRRFLQSGEGPYCLNTVDMKLGHQHNNQKGLSESMLTNPPLMIFVSASQFYVYLQWVNSHLA